MTKKKSEPYFHQYSAESMVERAVRNAKPHFTFTGDAPMWVAVMDAFGLGSTYARDLCRKHNLDPDETVSGVSRSDGKRNGWIKVGEALPRPGIPVVLFASYIVQPETFVLCEKIVGDEGLPIFWVREGPEIWEPVKPDHQWQYLPPAPAVPDTPAEDKKS